MENDSLGLEIQYEDYSDLPDVPVDCPNGACLSPSVLHVAPLVLYATIFLLGVPGNAMVAWVTGKEAGRRAWAMWFVHLAGADVLCCLALPVLAVPIAWQGHWPFGALGCRLLPSAILLSMYASVLLLTALSGDLCLMALRFPWWVVAWRSRGVQVARGAAWMLALLLTIPSAVHRRLHQEAFPSRLMCVMDYGGSVTTEVLINASRFLFGFLGPLVFVVGCHSVLLSRVAPCYWPLSIAIIVGFFVCWAPYHILGVVLTVAAPNSVLLSRALQVEPFVVGLALARSCLNPIIFLYFGRAQLCRSLPAACRQALRESQDKEESTTSKVVTNDLMSEMEI
ncbi:C5a anaphylatoxin chemotactic receptor 2 [Perognathus longimembris pacificus]|uniref:C5a anaphylatoxin chemotactic receptor 2 n=1 Tax=Perognathus longimembris pacificus TaxID=214514 RepID=UPI00201886A0|nr:C5a anaphylatoxin chemotactic receptor 2 [Perognathus longimembris pacificus]XP_048185712.1 C5a anaphylatoxin chemotactic receptor 2 [Perognathus longimembris pacificus]